MVPSNNKKKLPANNQSVERDSLLLEFHLLHILDKNENWSYSEKLFGFGLKGKVQRYMSVPPMLVPH